MYMTYTYTETYTYICKEKVWLTTMEEKLKL